MQDALRSMSAGLARRYIERRVFAPPEPALRYPVDVIDATSPLTRALFAETLVPCVAAEHPAPRFAICYFHGNSENLSLLLTFIAQLIKVMQATVVEARRRLCDENAVAVVTLRHRGQLAVPRNHLGCIGLDVPTNF